MLLRLLMDAHVPMEISSAPFARGVKVLTIDELEFLAKVFDSLEIANDVKYLRL